MVLKNDSGHLMCQLEGRMGTRKGSSCLQQIFPQFVFITYSFPLKRGKEGSYIRFLRKRQLLLVSFLMISAEETSSGTK